jgi:hypothetical protein
MKYLFLTLSWPYEEDDDAKFPSVKSLLKSLAKYEPYDALNAYVHGYYLKDGEDDFAKDLIPIRDFMNQRELTEDELAKIHSEVNAIIERSKEQQKLYEENKKKAQTNDGPRLTGCFMFRPSTDEGFEEMRESLTKDRIDAISLSWKTEEEVNSSWKSTSP